MSGREEWESIAATSDPDELRERIFTGFKAGKPFSPYVPTVPLNTPVSSVLDFGCGIGRNFPYLKSIAGEVVGFDLEPMIARCRALAGETVHALTSDWDDVSCRRFDLVFASLVLQHIDTVACRAYLADFAKMAPVTYVLTRLQSDFGMNVLGVIADSGLFEVMDCAEVEHDLKTNELRHVSRQSFAEASRATGNRHFEVVLIPRRSS